MVNFIASILFIIKLNKYLILLTEWLEVFFSHISYFISSILFIDTVLLICKQVIFQEAFFF